MLDIRPMSGYDIQIMLQELDAERWGGVLVGSIYHALKKLEKDNYIEIDSIEQTGHRQKAIYKITQKGQEYLTTLIFGSLKTSSVIYPSTLYSALSFMDKLPTDKIRKALEEQHNNLNLELQELEKGLEIKKKALGSELPEITKIVFDNMFSQIYQQKEFIEKILSLLK